MIYAPLVHGGARRSQIREDVFVEFSSRLPERNPTAINVARRRSGSGDGR
ncbi:hypothetical protein MUG78_10125 [Gordonia alkaliphila]|nr:hypothetical protein [Gordonia alkaliphila]MCK0439801.1 hypothetical protein [Gordonia alkaliphila]